ncbi:MAG: 50S ribosomal protein L3 [Candidatus Aenigmatarchaeota archaeon]
MPKHSRPRRGSMQFRPRVRARRIYPKANISNTVIMKDVKPMCFAAWKAGMTHVSYIDSRGAQSPTSGKNITKSVTVLDSPSLFVCGFRLYRKCPFSLHLLSASEHWFDSIPKELDIGRKTIPSRKKTEVKREGVSEVRLIVATQPKKSGMAKKKPDVFEVPIGGDDVGAMISYAESMIGKELAFKEIFKVGETVDVSAVTKGKGYEGPVKRFGIKIQRRTDKQMNRHVGSIGPTVPRTIDWRVPNAGQHGFHTRTESNKRILQFGDDPSEINPAGGFVGYGLVSGNYILIEGSVPGNKKRLVMIKKAVRPKREIPIDIKFVSQKSNQGA